MHTLHGYKSWNVGAPLPLREVRLDTTILLVCFLLGDRNGRHRIVLLSKRERQQVFFYQKTEKITATCIEWYKDTHLCGGLVYSQSPWQVSMAGGRSVLGK